jgi:hypothetical protein
MTLCLLSGVVIGETVRVIFESYLPILNYGIAKALFISGKLTIFG